ADASVLLQTPPPQINYLPAKGGNQEKQGDNPDLPPGAGVTGSPPVEAKIAQGQRSRMDQPLIPNLEKYAAAPPGESSNRFSPLAQGVDRARDEALQTSASDGDFAFDCGDRAGDCFRNNIGNRRHPPPANRRRDTRSGPRKGAAERYHRRADTSDDEGGSNRVMAAERRGERGEVAGLAGIEADD
ncbi:unnamed protein product, partial [Sphacelaria rigidula]